MYRPLTSVLAFYEKVTFAHANSPRHLLWRLETMALMSDVDLPAAHEIDRRSDLRSIVIQMARSVADGRLPFIRSPRMNKLISPKELDRETSSR